MKLVTAIVRTISAQKVADALKQCCVSGVTYSEVKGIGEQIEIDKPYTIHSKLEIVVSDENVDSVVNALVELTHMGLPGDGLITVSPLDYQVEIRTKKKSV
ncbi:MAG: hypothetical protein M0Z61_08855 [Nitrospiraceae bacterium]|nr:hypothetical protein [Nitrospiraceae bacterium]